MKCFQCYIDGATDGPQPTSTVGYAFLVKTSNKTAVELIGKHVGKDLTSKFAETKALDYLLNYLKEKDYKNSKIMIYSDCEHLVDQINSSYKVKEADVQKCREKFDELKKVNYLGIKWIPRDKNKEADKLSKKALLI